MSVNGKRWSGLAALFLLASVARGGDAPMSPLIERFVGSLTFYVDYDEDGGAPVIAKGATDIRGPEGEPRLVPGILGLGIADGGYTYNNEGNVDLTVPGTLIVWVSGWESAGDGAYIWPVIFITGRGTQHPLARMPKANSAIYAHFNRADGAAPDQNIVWIDYDAWGDDWHMLALTWDAESIGISVDGGAPYEKAVSEPLDANLPWFMAGAGAAGAVTDEVAVLNRKLTAEELKWLYEETLARSEAAGGR